MLDALRTYAPSALLHIPILCGDYGLHKSYGMALSEKKTPYVFTHMTDQQQPQLRGYFEWPLGWELYYNSHINIESADFSPCILCIV